MLSTHNLAANQINISVPQSDEWCLPVHNNEKQMKKKDETP